MGFIQGRDVFYFKVSGLIYSGRVRVQAFSMFGMFMRFAEHHTALPVGEVAAVICVECLTAPCTGP